MNLNTFALATVATVGLAGAASAASLSITGGTDVMFGDGNYSACAVGQDTTTCYDPAPAASAPFGADITTFFSLAEYPGLSIDGPAKLRVTFLGKEASATNVAFSTGGGSVTNTMSVGSSFTFVMAAAGTVNFSFQGLSGPAIPGGSMAGSDGFSGGGAIAFSQVGGGKVFAFFDDSGARQDRDWDDMVVSIEVVPLPATALLLLGGLGGLAAMRRRKAA